DALRGQLERPLQVLDRDVPGLDRALDEQVVRVLEEPRGLVVAGERGGGGQGGRGEDGEREESRAVADRHHVVSERSCTRVLRLPRRESPVSAAAEREVNDDLTGAHPLPIVWTREDFLNCSFAPGPAGRAGGSAPGRSPRSDALPRGRARPAGPPRP